AVEGPLGGGIGPFDLPRLAVDRDQLAIAPQADDAPTDDPRADEGRAVLVVVPGASPGKGVRRAAPGLDGGFEPPELRPLAEVEGDQAVVGRGDEPVLKVADPVRLAAQVGLPGGRAAGGVDRAEPGPGGEEDRRG